MRTANYSELRKNLKEHIDAVIADNDALIVDRGNNTGIVMISLEEYNSIMETEYIMSNPKVLADIQQSLQEISEGKGIEVNLATL
ncbi:MAG: type II toxin-antitoxin system Phd/YefM family antitoxin [Bacteroidales bacterium]|nr:type II toxin-antitoxin system Phd/YefM family antitoxin [Candidatus Cacconaster scatequi]